LSAVGHASAVFHEVLGIEFEPQPRLLGELAVVEPALDLRPDRVAKRREEAAAVVVVAVLGLLLLPFDPLLDLLELLALPAREVRRVRLHVVQHGPVGALDGVEVVPIRLREALRRDGTQIVVPAGLPDVVDVADVVGGGPLVVAARAPLQLVQRDPQIVDKGVPEK